jgi:hypothetical protein
MQGRVIGRITRGGEVVTSIFGVARSIVWRRKVSDNYINNTDMLHVVCIHITTWCATERVQHNT